MKPIFFLCCLLFTSFLFGQTSTINYTESMSDFPNPERGFYRYSAAESIGSYNPLDAQTLSDYRSLHDPGSGVDYDVYSTLVFRYFFLDAFKNSAISNTYLSNMQADFDAARQAGVKLIVRFAYTNDVDESCCEPDEFCICPPYEDAPKTWILQHIQQISSLLQSNKDVIAVVQMGFIGIWGENYYTDYFDSGNLGLYTQNEWQDRIDVLQALLDAVPTDRMVQVRYPQMKQKAVYGAGASTSAAALSLAQAHQGTTISRIGFHNDCFLASPADFGTFTNYDTNTDEIMTLKSYKTNDSKFVAVGGETCFINEPRDDCANQNGDADTELASLHYSYLNAEYNGDVNNDWQSDGCLDAIKRKLGYRFVLHSGEYSNQAQPGQSISVEIELENVGYAAPFNPRGVELILRHTGTGNRYYASLPDDPRFWLPGTHTLSHTLCLPEDMPTGSYALLLNLPAPEKSIYGRPEYAIQLANTNVWESNTGYNDLQHTVHINTSANSSACTGEADFQVMSSFLSVEFLRFAAKAVEHAVHLSWATSQESEHEGFHIQRSMDGKTFETIGWVAGAGMSTLYQFTDEKVQPEVTYFYRLKAVATDGASTFSPIVSATVAADKDNVIAIFPNPTTDAVRITIPENTTYRLQVFNQLGELVDEVIVQQSAAYSLAHLPKGIYRFVFSGQEIVTHTVTRQ